MVGTPAAGVRPGSDPAPPLDAAAEGDVNLSPLRRAFEAAHVDGATRALLDADAEVFLHQSLSTPCFNALASCDGIWLTDVAGRRIMDFHGNSVHQVGYRHPHVMAAVRKQLDTLPFSPRRYTNETAVTLARKLADLAPDPLGKVLFAPGGTLAIGMALKLARLATGRHKTLSLWDSFHGASLDAISIGGEAVFRKGIGPLLPGTEHASPCDPRACRFGCAGSCNLRCAEYLDYVLGKEEDIGAVVIETVRSTDVQIPPPEYYQIVRDACDRHGALMILDEIPICLGRTGRMFAFEHYGVVPDMVVLGKGLGGAVFPLAALIARRDLDVAADRALGHYTHEKSSVGCAAALATLEVIERESLCERAHTLGASALARLGGLKTRHPLVADVRGIGLLLAIELARDGVPARREAEQVMYECLARGLSFKVGQGNVLTLAPPLVIAPADLDAALDILDAALAMVGRDLLTMQTLLNLLAGVSLLVLGTHIVRTGILRLYGGPLRRLLRNSVENRVAAFFSGVGVTGLIQSSTATALIVAAFAGQGLIGTAPALAVMLGADVGTSLVTVVLSFDLSWLAPLLIFVGVVLFLTRQAETIGRFGRILIGLGLIIFALQWIGVAARPVVEAAGVKVIFASLTGDLLLDILVAALLTIVCYSSLAVVLLLAAFASLKVIALPVALGLVLGANLGSGLLGILSTLRSPPEARRVTLGNFLFKLIGCVLLMPAVGHIEGWIEGLMLDPAREVVLFHLVFNAGLALLFIFFTAPIARVAERLLPSRPATDDPAKPRHLDPSALDTPALAISCAAREALRIGDTIEQMLNGMLTVLRTNDRALAERLRKMDDIVDDLYTAVKLYLTQISRESLEPAEGRRWADIVSFTINMEQVGDIIERIITDVEDKKIDKGRNFSEAGMAEICDLHARLIANLRLGFAVFLDGELRAAQELLAQKVLFRDLERAYADSHLERLTSQTMESIETSSLHLDLISDLKRINSHICSIAYPILEQAGVLAKTRLKEPEPQRPHGRGRGNAAAANGRAANGKTPNGEPEADWQKRKPRGA